MKAIDDNIVRKILAHRGITEEEIPAFLDPALYKPTQPGEFPGMVEAVAIVQQALKAGERICIYGDYDVDGVTATTILVTVLKMLGGDVIYWMPDRFSEGYGMNKDVVRELQQKGVLLIITCDCGISNIEEVELAQELGMKVVVTDHHLLPGVLPPAEAIVNSQQLEPEHPAHFVPGVAVAYFLAWALLEADQREGEVDQFLDLVTLGVIADVVSLRGENRYLFQRGLPLIRQCRRPGLKALIEVASLEPGKITEEDIGFQLSPRINAAGRMEHASLAVELFLCETSSQAEELADRLDKLNEKRKSLGDKMLAEAEEILEKTGVGDSIILYKKYWHQGITGITAGRLCETYRVPVIAMSMKGDGETITGSARSIEGVHIYEVLKECEEWLTACGGHAGAAGISLEFRNLDGFAGCCSQRIKDRMVGIEKTKEIPYDFEVPLGEISWEFYQELRRLAPFGEGWPVPVFCCPGVEVLRADFTRGNKHLRLTLDHDGTSLPAIQWWAESAPSTKQVDLLYNIGINRWRGEEKIQLVVNALLKPGIVGKDEPGKAHIPKIIDYRSWRELGKPFPVYGEAIYFYEGLPLKDCTQKTTNRYIEGKANRLVLLTCPPSPQVFKEIVRLSGAKELVLAYSPAEIMDLKTLTQRIMSYIKYVVNKSKGHTAVEELAAVTGQTELLVVGLVRFLAKTGLLEVGMGKYGQMDLKMTPASSVNVPAPRGLVELLEETNAYRRHMNSCEIESVQL